MAARAPTIPTEYVDTAQLIPRKPVVFTEPDQVADDQWLCLDMENLILCDCFYPWSSVVDDPAVEYMDARYYTTGRNMCGNGTSENCDWAAFAWSTDGSTDFDVYLQNVTRAATAKLSVTASHTTQMWRDGSGTQVQCDINGTEDEYKVGLSRRAGTGTMYIAGIVIFSA